ncbi:MAG: 3,4-dihydroxy 2-butanone 4-phosphate synthase/GTP cyclohydrolase II [Halieaceae bacterium]|jgi:3,4-dihydroxy 2-butanone 4-phosphate synthase/GTP cyclohydrolase II
MSLNSITELIEDIRQGKMVILMDDEDRENEGDLIIAAEAVTPEIITFFSSEACGLICLPLTETQARRLKLPLMVRDNRSQHETNFTVSIDASERLGPGISSIQRAATVRAAVNPQATPDDINQPGHIFPLVAKAGGVLRRAGHTEAGIDLARMAGFQPAALIVEIMNEDGTMARRPQLEEFGAKHGIKIGTIADLIAYRSIHEQTVELCDSKTVETEYGEFVLYSYRDLIDDVVHYAMVKGEIKEDQPVVTRVTNMNPLRDLLSTRLPGENVGWSISESLQRVAAEGCGVVVLLGQTPNTEQALAAVREFPGLPAAPTGEMDGTQIYRLTGTGSQILQQLGVTKMRALASPTHYNALSGFNLEITEFIEA